MIRDEFVIDDANSVDKRILLDPDRFGYLSLHFVVSLNASRLQLAEYQEFAGCKAEIQIRSILQHSWAEVNHDLGYKTVGTIPQEIRRSFARVAGLLELADSEFVRIREALSARVSETIRVSPRQVELSKLALREFVRESKLVIAIDDEMTLAAGLEQIEYATDWIDKYLEHLTYFGLDTIADIERALQDHHDFLVLYAGERLSTQGYGQLLAGVSIAYLPYALAAADGGVEGVVKYFQRFGLYSENGVSTSFR